MLRYFTFSTNSIFCLHFVQTVSFTICSQCKYHVNSCCINITPIQANKNMYTKIRVTVEIRRDALEDELGAGGVSIHCTLTFSSDSVLIWNAHLYHPLYQVQFNFFPPFRSKMGCKCRFMLTLMVLHKCLNPKNIRITDILCA